jgi:hypothetical protein
MLAHLDFVKEFVVVFLIEIELNVGLDGVQQLQTSRRKKTLLLDLGLESNNGKFYQKNRGASAGVKYI